MGKGKGMLERQVLRVKKNFILFEFSGFSSYRLNKFCFFVNKRTRLDFRLFFLKNINYNL